MSKTAMWRSGAVFGRSWAVMVAICANMHLGDAWSGRTIRRTRNSCVDGVCVAELCDVQHDALNQVRGSRFEGKATAKA